MGSDSLALGVALDPRAPSVAYALQGYKSYRFTLYRGFARPGQWTMLPSPFPTDVSPLIQGMTMDGASSTLYVAARKIDQTVPRWPWLLSGTRQVWRTPNPEALNPQDVRWELVHDFGENVNARLLASGTGPQGPILFANLSLAPEYNNVAPVLYRSRDGGQTWEPLAMPSA
jgi:hypothetical protein